MMPTMLTTSTVGVGDGFGGRAGTSDCEGAHGWTLCLPGQRTLVPTPTVCWLGGADPCASAPGPIPEGASSGGIATAFPDRAQSSRAPMNSVAVWNRFS